MDGACSSHTDTVEVEMAFTDVHLSAAARRAARTWCHSAAPQSVYDDGGGEVVDVEYEIKDDKKKK